MATGIGSYGIRKNDPVWRFMERANKLLQEVAIEAREAGIRLQGNVSPRLELDHYDDNLGGIQRTDFAGDKTEFRIYINYRLAQCTDYDIKETLAHEICHASAGAWWPKKRLFKSYEDRHALAHSGAWLENMKKMNSLYGYSISATGDLKYHEDGSIYF